MHPRPTTQIATIVAVLAAANILARQAPHPWSDLAVPAGALAVVGLSRSYGVTVEALGLARSTWRTGLRYAGVAFALVVVVVVVAAALPLTRSAFLDSRYRKDGWAALRYALLAVPLLTVIPEELAFRGVLPAVIGRTYGRRAATVGSSVLFGLWHISSSLGLASDNAAVSTHLGSGTSAQVLSVLGAVAATTVAGVVFCQLRWRSGSLLAPIGLHWAVNGVAVLASAVVWRLTG